jgi:hypothetical protein
VQTQPGTSVQPRSNALGTLRPLILDLGIPLGSYKSAAFDLLLSTSPRFRTLERRFSLVWGVALLTECIVRVCCAFTLPVGTMVWLSTVLTLGAIGIGIVAGSFFSVPMETMVKTEAGK